MARKAILTGWMAPVLHRMVKAGAYVMPTSPGTIVTPVDGPLRLAHESVGSLVKAAQIAVAGNSLKGTTNVVCPAAPAAWALQIVANPSFGYLIRISDSFTQWKNGQVALSVQFNTLATRLFNFTVTGNKPILEFIILGITNNAGLAEVAATAQVDVTIAVANSAVQRYNAGPPEIFGTNALVQTLNARDLRLASKQR